MAFELDKMFCELRTHIDNITSKLSQTQGATVHTLKSAAAGASSLPLTPKPTVSQVKVPALPLPVVQPVPPVVVAPTPKLPTVAPSPKPAPVVIASTAPKPKLPTAAPSPVHVPAVVQTTSPVTPNKSSSSKLKGVAKKLFSKRASPEKGKLIEEEIVVSRPFALEQRVHVDLDPSQGFTVCTFMISFSNLQKGIPDEWKHIFDEVVTFWNRHLEQEPPVLTPTPLVGPVEVPRPAFPNGIPLPDDEVTLDQLINKLDDPRTLYQGRTLVGSG